MYCPNILKNFQEAKVVWPDQQLKKDTTGMVVGWLVWEHYVDTQHSVDTWLLWPRKGEPCFCVTIGRIVTPSGK